MVPPASLGKTLARNLQLAQLARKQHGLVSDEQMRGLGLSRSAISRRLASQAWKETLPGVYALESTPSSDTQHFLSVVLWMGEGCTFSHRSALELYGLGAKAAPWRIAPAGFAPLGDDFLAEHWNAKVASSDFIDVSSQSRRRVPEGIRLHRTARLPVEHVTVVDGLRVTSPARTLLDISLLLEDFEWEYFLDAFINAGWLGIQQLRSFLDSPPVRGLPGRRRVLRWLGQRKRSGEVRTLVETEDCIPTLIRRRGFPVPVKLQHPAAVPGLRLGYPRACVVLRVHGDDVWEDAAKLEQSRQAFVAAGWRVLELPYSSLCFAALPILRTLKRQLFNLPWPSHGHDSAGALAGLPAFQLDRLQYKLLGLAMEEKLPPAIPDVWALLNRFRYEARPSLSPDEVSALRPIILEINRSDAEQVVKRDPPPTGQELLHAHRLQWYGE